MSAVSTTSDTTVRGSISNISDFGLSSGEEFRVYALNSEGIHSFAEIELDGTFSIDVKSGSLYFIYILQDSNLDESFETHIASFDAVSGGALDLIPVYSTGLDIGIFVLPVGAPGSVVDLDSNPAIGQDMDADGVLDEVDDDINGNGLTDDLDLVTLDFDEDNYPNPIDSDIDGDTLLNTADPNSFDSELSPLLYEQDSDADGIADIYDIEPFSLSGSLNVYYVSGTITYIPPGDALTAVAVTTEGRFVRSVVDEYGAFSVPMRENEAFLLYFMNGNVVSNGQSTLEFRGIVDPISGGAPSLLAMGSKNLDLGRLTLPGTPLTRALNLSISILASRDSDGDGIADSVDSDRDGSGVADSVEALQLNFDSDMLPNILDDDDDNDSILDGLDTDRDGDSLADSIDADGDGISDSEDIDYDNDGQIDGTNPTLVEAPDLEVPILGTDIVFPAPQILPNSLRVNWGYARDNSTPTALLEYKVVRAIGDATTIDTAAEVAALVGVDVVQDWTANINTVDVAGLDYPETYFFAVVVRDEAGNQSLYTPQSQITVDSTAPTVGTAIDVGTPGATNVNVSWGAASDNITATGSLEYKLVYASTTAEVDTVSEANLVSDVPLDWSAGVTNFNVVGLDELTTYAFAVLVRDGAGNMSLYTPALATTLDVTAPSVGDGPSFSDLSDSSLTVEWFAATDNTTAQGALEYKVVSSLTAGGTDIDEIAEANASPDIVLDWTAGATSAAATSLTQSTEYYFSILVRDSSGNMSLYPPQSIITVNSSAPEVGASVISFGTVDSSSIEVNWGAATDDLTDPSLLEYKLVRATNPGLIDTIVEADAIIGADLVQDWQVNVLTAVASGLTSGERYYFNVLVKDGAGNMAIYSPASSVTSDIIAPNIGVGPSYSNIEATQVSVSWTAGSDNLTSASNLSYKVVRSIDPSYIDEASEADSLPSVDFVVVMDWTTATLSTLATGLEDNTDHYFAVFVRDEALNVSVYAPVMMSTLDGTAPEIEDPADNIVFSATTETETTLEWGAAADLVTLPAALEYKIVKVASASGAAIDSVAEINAITAVPQGLVMDWTAGSLLDPPTFSVTGLTHSTQYFFAVAVRDAAGNTAIYTPQEVTTTTPANVAPVVGSAIVPSGITDTLATLTWGAASDDLTPVASLQYKIVRASSSAAIDTVEEAETNGTIVRNWTANSTTYAVTGLTASTTYFFAVIVKDAAELKSLYAPQTVTTLAPMKRLFVSNSSSTGNFTLATADNTCNTEGRSRFDASKTYKAVISDGSTRTPALGTWTLAASTSYKDKNSLFIGTTNASKVFAFPLTQAIDSTLATNVFTWTGLNSDWTSASNNCTGWTASKNNRSGQAGSPFSTSSTSIMSSGGARKCGNSSRFYCAEQ